MRLSRATVVFATIFAVFTVLSEVFCTDLYCFSCFGYDQDGSDKCKDRSLGDMHVRKCTTNSSELPACIKYTAEYQVPQMMGKRLVEPFIKVHGVHCGTLRQCYRNDCPNFWPTDVKAKNCEVSCCSQRQFPTCSFPVPNQTDINSYKKRKAEESVKLGQAVAGQRSSEGTRIGWPVLLQAVSFAIVRWFKL